MNVLRYERDGQILDFEKALDCFRSAMCQPNASSVDQLTAGATMLQNCLTHSHWQDAFEAAEFVFERISNLALRSLDNEDKQHLLGLMAEVASDDVAAALFANKGCLAALNLLEQGRGVLAESIEAMRVDIMQLQEQYPDMAQEFVRLRDELEGAAPDSDDEEGISRSDQRYKTGKEFDKLIGDIRALPEVSSFLGPPSEAEIQDAAKDGPLVIINVSKYRCDALLVAVENTLGQRPLRFATQERGELRELCGSMELTPVEPIREKERLKECLQLCKIFHFAGHCSTNYHNPLNSHLFLDDGDANPLRVSDLLDINLHKSSPFLAYLSACGTGQILDETFIDESIHLISACQLAGFRHVIGTLWDVEDGFCVKVAKITYKEIGDGKMSDESVSRGLHKASRKLRDDTLGDLREFRKAGRQSRSDRTLDGGVTNMRDDGRGGLSRKPKFVDSDDEDDLETGLLDWVPYVHFGV
ncbi:hypothetical protein CEP51_014012 [Fusarium floridanum]|uniref:CHAT domain-containing protein n=1 Tax=Fusarium floridanum TaxID=1325733 RepID=A0A428Q0X3_9HYPO|nr:hypothetical protein CEP51_014012 [Fusarium floridanum]